MVGLITSGATSVLLETREDSSSTTPPQYLDKSWRQVISGVWYITTPLSPVPPITEKPHMFMDNNKATTPILFHPLAFLLRYLRAYFFLGRFNPLLGRYCLLGEIFHMGIISVPIGMLVTGLNPSTVMHHLGGTSTTVHYPKQFSHLKEALELDSNKDGYLYYTGISPQVQEFTLHHRLPKTYKESVTFLHYSTTII
ncbi:hypothetical protein DSO57_1006301 [Entomophthora muscae]|uniref:Uncharacterized protein n=1 Tax=Entomophthora muscae TaxID=34485 RepID=A0ACC2T7M3_9FUNG|nr:hypothetical protein DSO57_1006301 [Entomophthora muscae]